MMIWSLIIFSALTAFAFRLTPFFMKNSSLLNNQEGNFYRFLSYSTQAMLGVIIYDTAFHNKTLSTLLGQWHFLDTIKFLLLLITFIWVAKSKKILPSFFFGLIVYFIFVLIFYKG
jgi:branched-subunit amino acid transport protein